MATTISKQVRLLYRKVAQLKLLIKNKTSRSSITHHSFHIASTTENAKQSFQKIGSKMFQPLSENCNPIVGTTQSRSREPIIEMHINHKINKKRVAAQLKVKSIAELAEIIFKSRRYQKFKWFSLTSIR